MNKKGTDFGSLMTRNLSPVLLRLFLSSVLLCNQLVCSVFLAESWFFNLAGGISRNIGKDDLLWPFVSGQTLAEFFDLLFCAGHAWLYGNDRTCNLSKTGVGETDHGYIVDFFKVA